MTTLLMLDTITLSELRGLKFDALAGYVGGSWPTFSPECAAYPDLHKAGRVVSIAVNATEDADILDCEAGDAVPSQCGPWLDRQLARSVWRPGVYASLSTWQGGLEASLAHYGSTIRRWVADWTYHPELIAGFDCQQWTDHYSGRNIDGNQAMPDFFPGAVTVPHKNDPHYDWFVIGRFLSPFGVLNEHSVVVKYDRARAKSATSPAVWLLKLKLGYLARRCAAVAIKKHPLPSGKPSWGVDHRGWRYQQLIHRSRGRRFV